MTNIVEKFVLQNREMQKKIMDLEIENNNLKKITY